MQSEWIITSESQLINLAAEVLKEFSKKNPLVVCLEGDLGSGKTTFVQYLGRTLGVEEGITSPTFTIMSSYETKDSHFQKLIHIDAYRIENESEITPLYLGDFLQTEHSLICIEWPSKIESVLPGDSIYLQFEMLPDESRKVTIVSH